jgi:peroxiredoxin
MNENSPKRDVETNLVVGDRAPVVSIRDHEGTTIALSSLWQSRPRVLLFVRHFG